MLRTYKAIIKSDNRLKWFEEQPEITVKDKELFVYVTILEQDAPRPIKSNKARNTLVEFFRNSPLYDSGIDLEREKDLPLKEKI